MVYLLFISGGSLLTNSHISKREKKEKENVIMAKESKYEESIKESCKCGAEFEVDGSDSFCAARYKEFLEAHIVCRIGTKEFYKDEIKGE